MIVANTVFETGGRARGLNASNQAPVGEDSQGVIDGLTGDGPDLGPDDHRDVLRGRVRLIPHGHEDRQALGRHLDAEFAESSGGIMGWLL